MVNLTDSRLIYSAEALEEIRQAADCLRLLRAIFGERNDAPDGDVYQQAMRMAPEARRKLINSFPVRHEVKLKGAG